MASSSAKTVNEYLETLPSDRADAVAKLRRMILEVAPAAIETMAYRMPTYQYGPGLLCAVASQKNYMDLYVEVEILERHRDDFGHLNCGKSCIRFSDIGQLPLDAVRTILTETRERIDALPVEANT